MRGLFNIGLMPLLLLATVGWRSSAVADRHRRGLELSSVHHIISDTRLAEGIVPIKYSLMLAPVIEESSFSGMVEIVLNVTQERSTIELHAHYDLVIKLSDITVRGLMR